MLDKDGDGNISNDEIRSLMNSLGYSPSEEDISTVISKVDTNGKRSNSLVFYCESMFFYFFFFFFLFVGNGSVDFDEFLTMMRRRRSTGESDSELHQVFKVNRSFDDDEREEKDKNSSYL